MKKILFIDTCREIINTKKRFISILLMAFLGVGFFAGIKATSPDMQKTIDKYYDDNELYDIEIMSTLGLTNEDIERIRQIEEVENAFGIYSTDVAVKVSEKENIFKVYTLNENVNKVTLISGDMPTKYDECLVENSFLEKNSLQIGDYIELDTKNDGEIFKEKRLKIVGTASSPLYISRSRGNTKLGSGTIDYYMYVPKENIDSDIYTQIYVTAKNAKSLNTCLEEYKDYIADVKSEIEDIKQEREEARYFQKWYILDRYNNAGFNSFVQDTQSIANLGKVFPIVFFVIATLISLTSMTRMVEEQRGEIGTLKTLGYTGLQIASKYIIYALLACILGGFAGISIGFVLLPKVIWRMYCLMYSIPNFVIEFNVFYGAVGILAILVCVIGATIFSINKEIKQMPAVLMRPKAPGIGKRVLLERISFIWKRLNFIQKITVRNMFRYKKRFLLTIIGIFGCTSLILTGFGIRDSITTLLPEQYGNIFKYDLMVIAKSELTNEELQAFKEDLINKEEIETVVETYMSSLEINNSESAELVVANDTADFYDVIELKNKKTKERLPLNNDEIIITDKLSELINVKIGDTVTLKNGDNEEVTAKVGNIAKNNINHYIYMTKDLYNSLYGDYKTNVFYIKNIELTEEQENDLSKQIIDTGYAAGVNTTSSAKSIVDDMVSSLNYIVVILIVSSGLLAFVVLYNLANVNISERIRELATIKVLGFYDNEVYQYLNRETIILTIIGCLLGLVGGHFLSSFIMVTCEVQNLRFDNVINIPSYIYSILITVIFTAIVNVFTYFTLKKIKMIESLKSVE